MAERTFVLKSQRPSSRLDLTRELNESQREVVTAPRGPLLCIAGAGTGKTRTLTWRAAWFIDQGIAPERLLLLTFTHRAAREMLERVATVLGGTVDPKRVVGGTFHQVGLSLLRRHGAALGLPPGFTVMDREDATDLMDACLGESRRPAAQQRFPRAALLVDLVSEAVNTRRHLHDLLAEKRPQFLGVADEVMAVATAYLQRKADRGLCDFDDLLLHWRALLQDHPEVRSTLQGQFDAVLVDEYQDTNKLQGELIDLMAAGHRNLTVVGDDAQSIYGFRGADFTNILEFPARYPGAAVKKLVSNYRSTPEILALANASLALNRRQFPKQLVAQRPSGLKPALVPLRDVLQQAEFVAQRIGELHDEGIPLGEQAVLYRAHSHALELQLELARRGIPFVVRSGVRFTESAHVKDVLAHLRFVANPRDELAFKRMVRLRPGFGPAKVEALWSRLLAQPEPMAALLASPLATEVPPRGRPAFAQLQQLLRQLCQPEAKQAPGQLVLEVLEGGYRALLDEGHLEGGDQRARDLEQLAQFAGQYDGLDAFLGDISLLSEFAVEAKRKAGEPDERVVLSSIHQAKGLEWRVVHLIWLVEGRFPSGQGLVRLEEEEEERRLFHVACTRARDELYLCHPLVTERERERLLLRVSRFVEELPDGDEALWDRVSIQVAPA